MDDSQKLKDYTNKIDKVMKYTDNDINRAKEIVQGNFKDVVVIKARITSDAQGTSGAALIFLHTLKHNLLDKISILVDNLDCVNKFHVDASWLEFFKLIDEGMNKKEFNAQKMTKLDSEMQKELTGPIVAQMLSKIENKDITSVTVHLEKISTYAFGNNDYIFQISYEEMTSLEYEEIVKTAAHARQQKEGLENKKKFEKNEEKNKKPISDDFTKKKDALLSDGNTVINGSFNLSPIKGKFISELQIGHRVGVKIDDEDKRALNVVKQLGLMTPEGKIKSTKGKVIFFNKDGNGYNIIVQISPLVLVSITAEEELKIENFTLLQEGTSKPKKKSKGATPVIIISSILTLVIIVLLIIFLTN